MYHYWSVVLPTLYHYTTVFPRYNMYMTRSLYFLQIFITGSFLNTPYTRSYNINTPLYFLYCNLITQPLHSLHYKNHVIVPFAIQHVNVVITSALTFPTKKTHSLTASLTFSFTRGDRTTLNHSTLVLPSLISASSITPTL